jgi:hypothetical protein
MRFAERENAVDVFIGDRGVATYRYGPELVKPVIHPLKTLSGLTVTRAYPFEEFPEESHDHPHHTGVFFTYDDVDSVRFWAATSPPPQIRQIGIDSFVKRGMGTIATTSQWIDKNGKVLLEERRTMLFAPGGKEYTVDFDITLAAVDTTVTFGPTKEGMFAIRVAPWLQESGGTGAYLSSRSVTSAGEIWGRRAEWVRIEGESNGRRAGVAILNHPASVNHPTYWHTRDYGLFSANPLGQTFFEQSRKTADPELFVLTIKPGERALFRFRVIAYDGSLNKLEMDSRYNAYSRK